MAEKFWEDKPITWTEKAAVQEEANIPGKATIDDQVGETAIHAPADDGTTSNPTYGEIADQVADDKSVAKPKVAKAKVAKPKVAKPKARKPKAVKTWF